jgi:hypothetical protein
MLKKISATLVALSVIVNVQAQSDSTPKSTFTLSGSADVYYKYDFNKTVGNNKTSFTNSHNSFELGMASLKAEHTTGKVSMVADLGFGRRAEEFSYNDANSMLAIKQLYLSYAIANGVKLTAGSWATHVGYELVDAFGNRNYSMSYMFSYGPFFHTGVKAEFAVGKKSALMVGIANPTDFKSASGAKKFAIAQFATASSDDKLKLYVNYQGGKTSDSGRLNQADVVLTYAATDKFSIGYNGTAQFAAAKVNKKWEDAQNWYGSALYLNYDPSSTFGLTFRNELFSDKKELTVAGLGGGTVFSSTLSANFKVSNLTIIPEVRIDNASNAVFAKSSGAATKSAASFILAGVYKF